MPRTTLNNLLQRRNEGRKLAFLTCYEATTARHLAASELDGLLIGDTAAQMILGYDCTVPATADAMVLLTAAVRRGAPNMFLMADMPFGLTALPDDAVRTAMRFLQEAEADCVKLEVSGAHADLVKRLSTNGIPVAAHIGCRPQQVLQSGYRRQTEKDMQRLLEEVNMFLEGGACMLLLESVESELASTIQAHVHEIAPQVLTIGCGAGNACDGQVIVSHDLFGLSDWQPPFARPQAQMGDLIRHTATQWARNMQA